MMKKVEELLKEHRFFEGMPPADVELIAGCGKNVVLPAGRLVAHEGAAADVFYVVREGKIAIETHGPGTGPIVLETLGAGELVGWSWLFPPYEWTFDVRAVEKSHVVAIDGRCLRKKSEADPALGYRLMKSFARVMTERLRAARLQLIDVYGHRKVAKA